MALEETLALNFFGNSIFQYLFALGVFLAMLFLAFVFKKYFLRLLRMASAKTRIEYDDMLIDMLEPIKAPLFIVLALYIALKFISVPRAILDISYYLLMIGILYYAVRVLQATIDFFASEYQKKTNRQSRLGGGSKAIKYLSIFAKWMLWLFAALILVANLGIEITPLIAGLGIGGIAIALAMQNILGDIFNFFAIYLDKPFMEGDFLIIGDDMGVVEKIGLRSTRIKALRGEELVVSNNELTGTRIHNFKKMQERRIQFGFGVTYETPVKKLEKIPAVVKKVVEGCEKTRLDRAHFKEFGDFSLNYEVVYYLGSADYNIYMDTQQKINLGLKKALEKEKIGFAYPTQLVYTAKA